jgi:hypothetical protein
MKDYQTIIDTYSLDGYHMYSKRISRLEWGDIEAGSEYLDKYWLSLPEYKKQCERVQNMIFINQDEALPQMIFSNKYHLLVAAGGCLFTEEDFKSLQTCILKTGEKSFFIIENDFGGKLDEPTFRMKFPANISWEELFSGNFVSSTMIESIHKEFFVFGESGLWGKYSASDYKYPVDIVGFKPEYKSIFQEEFCNNEAELKDVQTNLPDLYRRALGFK